MKLFSKLKSIIIGTYYNICNKHNDLANWRLPICAECKERINLSQNIHLCDQCGCVLESKVRVRIEHCPLNKW
jgi:hypothetical protein